MAKVKDRENLKGRESERQLQGNVHEVVNCSQQKHFKSEGTGRKYSK